MNLRITFVRYLLALLILFCGPAFGQARSYELQADQRTGTIKRIFVLCHSHLDIGFTRPPDEVARDYKDNIDAAIRLTRENQDFRWTIESAWMLEEWLRRTDDEALIAELGRMLSDGRMGLGPTFATMHSGLMGAEESNRLVYLGEKFRREFGIKAEVAFQNDVPGFTWAYPRMLAASGIKRLITGLNLFIGGGNSLGVANNPFYWVGPDGSRVLTYFTYDSYVEASRWKLGGRFTMSELERSLPRRLSWLERNGYKYDTYLLMASPGDNIHPMAAFQTLERIREWNLVHPELPMKMATAEEFFAYLIEKYGDHFPSASGDSAGHWETVKLKVPEAAAKMRQMSNDLPAAETAATIASLLRKSPFPQFDLSAAWYSLLTFHEHTADAGGGWPRYFSRWDADWSNTAHYSTALNGFSNTQQVFRRSMLRIAAPDQEHTLVAPGSSNSATATIMVYNGLSWQRSGPVIVERLPIPLREGPLAVTDVVTGEKLPYEDVPDTERRILFFAKDVPAIGYRLYSVEKAEQRPATRSQDFPLKVTWNPEGWITSILDQRTQREMVHSSAERPFGGLFISRGRNGFQLEDAVPAQVNVHEGPVTRRIEITRKGSPLPRTMVELYRDGSYADLQFDVDLGALRDSTAGNLRYALALTLPAGNQMFLDGAGFVMRVPQEILPGGRPPQFTPVHFWHQQQAPSWGVTLANKEAFVLQPDLLWVVATESLSIQTREEGVQRLFRGEPRSSPVQSFRFRIAVQDEEPWQWKRLGAGCNLPLRSIVFDSRSSPAKRGFFELSDPGVQLLAFKPAESRPGWYMLRMQEIAGRGAKGVRLTTPFRFKEAVLANLVEQPQGATVDFSNISIQPWQTMTILARLE